MKVFYQLLANTLVASVTNNFLWFALTFWAYLETQSVLATSIIGGSYMLFSAVFGLFFGTFVDHHKKKLAMLYSSFISLIAFGLATVLYVLVPREELLTLSSLEFWAFVLFILAGAVAGNMRTIALSTTVTMLVPETGRAKANGLVGTTNGVSFAVTSVFSGLAIGMLGMGWSLGISLALTMLATLHLLTIRVREHAVDHEDKPKKLDIKGTIKAIHLVPGLMALIFFATFNNFLGGVFMSLMDPYGLSLMSVESWGILWGFMSVGFIAGGLIVARKGLGASPLKTLFLANIAMWIICIMFPVRSSVVLLAIGMFVYMILIPVVESAEQTIIQKVVPFKKQGRVFGFAQSIESAASPITAFLIGPIAQFWAIPFMEKNGTGANAVGNWFGVGPERGMALIFIIAGIVGLLVTLYAMSTRSYRILGKYYTDGRVPASALPLSPRM